MKFFYMALKHDLSMTIWADVNHYLDLSARLIIAMETSKTSHQDTSGQHFHFACDMNDKQYDAFKKTIIIKKFGLQGQAKNGTGRQYGVIPESKVRDETKFLNYTCKDNNLMYRNISPEDIDKHIKESYKKDERKTDLELLMEHLGTLDESFMELEQDKHHPSYNKLVFKIGNIHRAIIKYYMFEATKPKVLSRASVRSLTTRYLMYHYKYRVQQFSDIEFYIMN